MLKNRKHDYRLSKQPAEFFTHALERSLQSAPHITEAGHQIANWTAKDRTIDYQIFDETKDPFYFHLLVLKANGLPDEQDLQTIRSVFGQLIEMDDAARAIPCHHDENEELFAVRVDPSNRAVFFEYSSTLWNTEWEVHFTVDEKGEFECLGMPNWKSPGDYII